MLTGAAGSPETVLTLPGDGRVELGSSVVLQCELTIDSDTRSSSSITWYRRLGDVEHNLGVEDHLIAEFGSTNRVKITRVTSQDSLVSNLTISGKLMSFTAMWSQGKGKAVAPRLQH